MSSERPPIRSLSVPDLVEAQESASRPRSASNVVVGAAFSSANISPTAHIAAAGAAAQHHQLQASRGNSMYSRGGTSSGLPAPPMSANQLNQQPLDVQELMWQQQQQQRAGGSAGSMMSAGGVSPAFGTGSLPALASPSPTSGVGSPPSIAQPQQRHPSGGVLSFTPDAMMTLGLAHFPPAPPGSAAGRDSVVDENEDSGSIGPIAGGGPVAAATGGLGGSNNRSGGVGAPASTFVPVDDSAWGSEFDYISNQHLVDQMWSQFQQQEDDEEEGSVAEPQLRSLPAPYMVPFPGAREVRLDVQTMRVRMLQRGFVDPETVGGMRCSSALSVASASESRGNSATTAGRPSQHQQQHQQQQQQHHHHVPSVPHPVPSQLPSSAGGGAAAAAGSGGGGAGGGSAAPRFPLSSAGGGTSSCFSAATQQQRQLQNKFRLCVWKYLPANPALGDYHEQMTQQSNTNNGGSGGGDADEAGAGAGRRGNVGSGSGNRLVQTPGGTIVSRWAMTPSGSRRSSRQSAAEQQAPPQAAAAAGAAAARAPAFMRLTRDIVFSALSFLSTGELAIASQVCAAWFLVADPWVFLEHYGWVPLGPLSRATRVSLRLSRADDGVLPELFTALSQTLEHLQLEFVGGVPTVTDRSSIPHLTRLKSLELLRPTQHDIGQIAASLCAPLSGADRPEHRLHCVCINRAQVNALQSNNFAAPLLALRAARLVIRRTVTLLPSALRLLSGSARFPQLVIDRCIVLPTTEAPVLPDDQEEPQMLVSGIVDDTVDHPQRSTTVAASAAAASGSPQRPRSPACELACCNFFVDSDLRPIRTPVAQMSRRRLYRLLVSQGRVATATTSDEESLSSRGGAGLMGSTSGFDSRGTSAAGGDTPLISAQLQHMMRPPSASLSSITSVQQRVVVPKNLCLQCLIWEKPCVKHAA